MPTKKDGDAFQRVNDALKDVDDAMVLRIVQAVLVLRGIEAPTAALRAPTPGLPAEVPSASSTSRAAGDGRSRPKSIGELVKEKAPASNTQKLLLYAYYLDRYRGQDRFSREGLRQYYTDAREKPNSNFDRDIRRLVQGGLIHEDGANSFITSTGIEAVESNFETMRPGPKGSARSASKSRKKGKGSR